MLTAPIAIAQLGLRPDSEEPLNSIRRSAEQNGTEKVLAQQVQLI